ncbi:ABC transporter ATP-binding protein [Helicobacter sp. 12S02634-8]|uniref:ABC transporter ATP-binding protein n=1 Tax=Helicobacter sp. 12S02634-8 TaxID=1476199 RepID=UPI000BA63CB5|nr:ABC transporter ATP-binding protein [Helicobacter sp. 12S02634-8]PAF48580.1 ABC transporter ATP-binding protein [Helicobacter sp. 12S02634-8]
METSLVPLISIKHLSKSYAGTKVLDGINLTIWPKQIIGLLGPNGAGKTTLLKILAHLLTQFQGSVSVNGQALGLQSKKIIAYLPDIDFLDPNVSTKDMLGFYQDFFEDFQMQKALKLLEQFSIPPLKRLKTLSKGTKEKIRLILTLSRKAKLYLLDEPIAGVDPLARQEIFDLILQNRSADSSVIISTHLVADVERYLNQCIFIKEGKIIAFAPTENITNGFANLQESFKEYFR